MSSPQNWGTRNGRSETNKKWAEPPPTRLASLLHSAVLFDCSYIGTRFALLVDNPGVINLALPHAQQTLAKRGVGLNKS